MLRRSNAIRLYRLRRLYVTASHGVRNHHHPTQLRGADVVQLLCVHRIPAVTSHSIWHHGVLSGARHLRHLAGRCLYWTP